MKVIKQLIVTFNILAAVLCCLAPGTVRAGGPIRIDPSTGRPFVWANGGRDIVFHTDLGGLGTMSNAGAVAQTIAAFNQWQSIPTATASFIHGGSLAEDVNETNFWPYLFRETNGINPVVYDEDGAIFELLFGVDGGILGFSSPLFDNTTGEIVFANVFLNGAYLTNGQYSEGDFFGLQVHETGHFMGLGHSVVNGEIFAANDATGPTPFDTFPRPASADNIVETMYAVVLPGVASGESTPDADDRAIFSALYPGPDFSDNSGTITGRILGINGQTPLNGINVIARNLADPYGDAVSSISGSFAATNSPDDPQAGVYILGGLTPGAQYVVYVDELFGGQFNFADTSFLLPPNLPGPEEFYNGAAESNDPSTDHPNEFTPLTAVAGSPLTGIDIVFNRVNPGPIPLEAFITERGIRPWLELPLEFSFEIGGRQFDSVFLNLIEGSLTFGGPSGLGGTAQLFSPQRASYRHLLGPPRVAGLMPSGTDLLDPYFSGSGVVAFNETAATFTITYENVPATDFDGSIIGGPNTFSMTLHAKKGGRGNQVTLAYGDIGIENAVVGHSAGRGLTSGYEPESDLSGLAGRLIRGDGQAAIYEEFTGSDFDLGRRSLIFEMPGVFADQFEPNNSFGGARRITLPFNTAQNYADLRPGDVDFYRFRAKAGQLLVAETGRLGYGLALGLFGPAGELLERDRGCGCGGPRRLTYTIPTDGDYTLALTDVAGGQFFTGASIVTGRYVLSIRTYNGVALPLNGDDVAVELPLNFAFPFQGSQWQSVWVSSNGNLTFGGPEPANRVEDFQIEGFLGGPPRIAPFLTDLDPSRTYTEGIPGLIIAEQKADSVTIHWVSVPRIFDPDTNTFSVTLNADGNIRMNWDAALTSDWDARGTIVGVTPGGAIDPLPTDLSRLGASPSAAGTTYEQFAAEYLLRPPRFVPAYNIPSFDLSFRELRFVTEP